MENETESIPKISPEHAIERPVEIKIKKPRAPKRVTPNLNLKSGRVWLADQKGTLNPGEIAKEAGINVRNLGELRDTQNYKMLEGTYAGSLMKVTTLDRMAELNKRNMEQDKDIGGSNNAIRMALEKIEPDNRPQNAQQINITVEDGN